ncbi:MAG: hypothetical protein HN533_02120, partial [Euryarchaeota archaeon]|nr:hypothetical protein [Euryarchaeota archaeon]
SHSMFADRLQYLPGNQIEGNQTLMVRAILEDSSSTNLIVHLFISESVISAESSDPSSNNGIIIILGLIIISLLITISFLVMRNQYEFVDESLDINTDASKDENI